MDKWLGKKKKKDFQGFEEGPEEDILLGSLRAIIKKRTRIYKDIILYFNSVTIVWSRRAIGESLHTRRKWWESELPAGTDFSQNSRPYILLILLRDPYGHAYSPTQCLLSISHCLYTRIVCLPVVTAGCICQLHLPSSSQVKAIYYTWIHVKELILIDYRPIAYLSIMCIASVGYVEKET